MSNTVRAVDNWADILKVFALVDCEPEVEVLQFLQSLRLDSRVIGIDIGCGFGRHAVAAAAMGSQIVGVDISRHAVEQTRRALRVCGLEANGDVILADSSHLPFHSGSFDFAVACCSLSHGTRKTLTDSLNEGMRVLREGASLCATLLCNRDPRYGKGVSVGEDAFIFTEGPEAGICHYFANAKMIEDVVRSSGIVRDMREIRYSGKDIQQYHPAISYASHILVRIEKTL